MIDKATRLLWRGGFLSDRELCHSPSKPIGDEEGILKSFIAFDITSHGLVFRVVVGSQIMVPPTLSKMLFTKILLFFQYAIFKNNLF